MTSPQGFDPGRQLLIAKRLLERGCITPSQLREALANRGQGGSGPGGSSLEILLLSKGFITQQKLDEILSEMSGRKSGESPAAPGPVPPSPPPAASGPPSSAFLRKLGKYTLIRELGRGGMGAVYEALDIELNRKVALKLMVGNPNADPQEMAIEEERFIREAKLAAQIKHDNIVSVYEAGVVDGRRFLAMELIVGKPFSSWRKQESPTVRQQVAVLRDVALAVHPAHAEGVLHRAIKPRNILIAANNRPYVTDFGLAKTLAKDKNVSLTASGMVVGTPTYMSPEQCQGSGRIDWRSDIWSMGIMLFEILAGKSPFGGDSPMDIMTKVVRDPVPPPSKVALDGAALAMDSVIERICLKALAKDPKDRYATAKVFAEDLAKWVSGQEVKVSAPRLRKVLPRRVLLEAAGLVAILAAAAATYLATRPSVQPHLKRAREHESKQEYDKAIIEYSVALTMDPGNEEAKARLADARLKDALNKNRLDRELKERRLKAEQLRREIEDLTAKRTTAATEEERAQVLAQLRKKEEIAREEENKAGELSRKLDQPAPPTAPNPSRIHSWEMATNLFSHVNVQRDALWGQWSMNRGDLHADRTPHARIEIPYELPEEYDILLAFTRIGGGDSVSLILSRGGSPFALEMGASRNRLMTLAPPATREDPDAPTSHRMLCLENKREYTAVVQVRRDGVQAFLEGVPLVEWKGDPARLGIDPRWKLRDDRWPGLGSHQSPTVFSSLKILEVTGRGRHLAPDPPPALKSHMLDAASLHPGLVGEYFYGTHFDVLAVRRIDPALSFSWKEESAWPNGPRDAFSARWTGYLDFPRGGDAAFVLSADGAARLLIDGAQVVFVDAGGHGGTSRTAERALEPGLHALTLEFVEHGHTAGVRLAWAEEKGKKPDRIGSERLFHDPAAFQPYVLPALPGSLATLSGHSNNVTCVAFSPDGQTVASVDGKLRVWDAGQRSLRGSIAGHTWGTQAVAFSPDGLLMATGGNDARIRLWDAAKRTELRALHGHGKFIRSLAFSPDGKRLVSGSQDHTILLWDTARGKEVRMVGAHAGPCTAVAFSPDGTKVASAGEDRTLRLWNLETGVEARKFEGHAGSVDALAFSPDGRLLASAGKDGTVRLWDAEQGAELRTLAGHRGEALCVAFHPGGKLLASGGQDSMIRFWDASTGDEARLLAGHAGPVISLAFAPGGRTLASGSTDMTVRLWECDHGRK